MDNVLVELTTWDSLVLAPIKVILLSDYLVEGESNLGYHLNAFVMSNSIMDWSHVMYTEYSYSRGGTTSMRLLCS